MKILNKKDKKIIFSAELEESLVNAIRRYVNQIPVIAIDEVEISKNDSPLYDETIAHRMGLIPLEGGKEGDEITLSSKKEGYVYSGDLKNAKIVYDKIPITLLNKGQEIEIKGFLKTGKGNEHSKFSPGIIFYKQIGEIIADKKVAEELKGIFSDIEIKEKGNQLIILDNKEKNIGDVYEGICNKIGKEAEIKPTGELLISIESFGQIKCEDILKKSMDILKKDLNEVSKKLK